MTPRRLAASLVTLAVAAVLVVGLLQLGSGSASPPPPSRLTLAQMRSRLAGSPAPLAALHEQANELLRVGLPGIRSRLAALRGEPIVINKWASWCEPCQQEFGVFQRVATSMGREVAFLGIDSGDTSLSRPEAFLKAHPVPYPSYYDPTEEAGQALTDSGFTPVTVFYNRRGGLFIYQGEFPSVAKLERAVRRYALES